MAPLRHAIHILPELMRPVMQTNSVDPDHSPHSTRASTSGR